MRKVFLFAALLAAPALAQDASAQDQSAPDEFALEDLAEAVSAERLRADVAAMVAFGTRHTLSAIDDPARGIGAARRWGGQEFARINASCGNCLEIVYPQTMVTGDRIPDPVLIQNVVAIQRGTERPDEVVIIMGHIDSRGSDVMDAEVEAPGANDNASGSALVLEAARVLSQSRYPTTIVYALLSGEEQGLFGGELLADYAGEQGWTVKAVLNNDVVGGSCGSDGVCDDTHVRVFSEGVRSDADEQTRARMRSRGGANDSPSRNLSRWIDGLAASQPDGLDVRQTWRSDRMGRGGDHLPFLDRGYPAIRFTAAIEDYEHQHQDLRVEGGVTYGDTVDEMDFDYLAQVTALNVQAADVLARAPMPPVLEVDGIVRTSTELSWPQVDGATSYAIYQRRTDQANWPDVPAITMQAMDVSSSVSLRSQYERRNLPPIIIAASGGKYTVEMVALRGDDWFFGVSAIAADGAESPVSSAVPGGAFYPLTMDAPIDSAD